MEPCRSLALLTGSLGLVSSLTALSTDFWVIATGPNFSAHSGLWPTGPQDPVTGYIHVTQSFCILAALWNLVSVGFLVLTCIPALSAPGRGPLVSTITAFAAALSMMVAMAVYTSERWSQHPHPQIQTSFSWSFYLGWVSTVLFLCAGSLSLGAHCGTRRADYETFSLHAMGVKRSLQTGGVLLSFLTSVLTVLSTATNYWTRQQGGHSGLWQECTHNICSNIPCQTTVAVTAACMVLAATFSIVALAMGLRIRCQEGDLRRGQTTMALLFLSGLLLLIALIGFAVKNAWKQEVFFSWSYFIGWLALPFSFLAGFCFLLADMILQSTEAINGFPVCL